MEPLFINLEERRKGREVLSTLSDNIEDDDEAARFLAEKRRELITDPVRAAVQRISKGPAHIIKAVLEKPDDPNAVFELAKKLIHRESSDALEAAKRLIGLSWDNDEIPQLRWPDNEQHIVLAAWILRKEQKFQAVVKMLTDETGRPRFSGNPYAYHFLVQSWNALHQPDKTLELIHSQTPEFFSRDPVIMLDYILALLEQNNELAVLLMFSDANPYFREHAEIPFVRPILQRLHSKERYDLMLAIVKRVLAVNPTAAFRADFIDFASRACNANARYEEAVRLLVSTDQPIRALFPRNAHCMMNLVHALISLGRLEDAQYAIEQGIAHGLDWHVFASFQKQLRAARRSPQAESPRDHV